MLSYEATGSTPTFSSILECPLFSPGIIFRIASESFSPLRATFLNCYGQHYGRFVLAI